MSIVDLHKAILDCVAKHQAVGSTTVAAGFIQSQLGYSRPTINRALALLVANGHLLKLGAGRSIAYQINSTELNSTGQKPLSKAPTGASAAPKLNKADVFQWSKPALKVASALSVPLGARKPITYQRSFVEAYQPNQSALLHSKLACDLFQEGKAQDQLPAGTYARKVLEQLLIDLSWSSSRLEGNRKSLLDTRALFEKGRFDAADRDSVMLLNHKEAIEFLVDAVPTDGITLPVVRNLQSILMRDLLDDPEDLGSIRKKIVNIQGTVYIPSQAPHVLEEMLQLIVDKACQVRNPVEAAFFLWVNIAYLQPFVDGNKRTSRLAANMPFLLSNCAPLSFLDVEPDAYALAMIAVYEKRDVTLAAELFAWTYRRSIACYQVVVEAMGDPNPLRVRYREQLGEAMRQIVFYGLTLENAIAALDVAASDRMVFVGMVQQELKALQPYNCARYRLPMGKTAAWIKQGRPC